MSRISLPQMIETFSKQFHKYKDLVSESGCSSSYKTLDITSYTFYGNGVNEGRKLKKTYMVLKFILKTYP